MSDSRAGTADAAPAAPGPDRPSPPSQEAIDVAMAALPIVLFTVISTALRPTWSMTVAAIATAFASGRILARAAACGWLHAAAAHVPALLGGREAIVVGWLLVAHAAFKLPFVNLVPRWDAGQYALMLFGAIDAYTGGLGDFFVRFRLADHPTHAMSLYWALGQFLMPFDYRVVNVQDLALSLFGIACFASLVRGLFPASGILERALVVSAFAFQPLFFAGGLGPNVDLGICVFLIFALAAYVHGRAGLFAMAGLFLCFSKETGFLLYGEFVLLAGLTHILNRRPVVQVTRRVALIGCAPLVAYLLYLIVSARSAWTERAMGWSNSGFLTFGFQAKNFFTVLGEGLLLNFLWIPTLACLAACLVTGLRRPRWRRSGAGHDAVLIAAMLFASFLAINSLYINFLNPRYLLALVPLSLVLFARSLQVLLPDERPRTAVLAVFVLLSFGQVWATLDPVSRFFFGTMDVGNGTLLAIDPGGQSMVDAQVYNAQFAGIARIYERMNRRIFRDGRRPIVLVGRNHSYAYYYNCCWVDEQSLAYTYRPGRGFMPTLMLVDQLAPNIVPRKAVYVAVPWLEDTERSLARVRRFYRVDASEVFAASGYRVTVYDLEPLEGHPRGE